LLMCRSEIRVLCIFYLKVVNGPVVACSNLNREVLSSNPLFFARESLVFRERRY